LTKGKQRKELQDGKMTFAVNLKIKL